LFAGNTRWYVAGIANVSDDKMANRPRLSVVVTTDERLESTSEQRITFNNKWRTALITCHYGENTMVREANTPYNIIDSAGALLGLPEDHENWSVVLEGRFIDVDGDSEIPDTSHVYFDDEKPDLASASNNEDTAPDVARIAPPESLLKAEAQDKLPPPEWLEAMQRKIPSCYEHENFKLFDIPDKKYLFSVTARMCVKCKLVEVFFSTNDGTRWVPIRDIVTLLNSNINGEKVI